MAITTRTILRNPVLVALLAAVAFSAAAFCAFIFCSTCAHEPRNERVVVTVADRGPVIESAKAQRRAATTRAQRNERGWLGVRIETLSSQHAAVLAKDATLRGVRIVEVQPGQPAERAGFEPNDIVTHFDGKRVTTHCQLKREVMSTAPGTRVAVEVVRRGKKVTLMPELTTARANRCGARK